MSSFTPSNPAYFEDHNLTHHQIPVKVEGSASPDLSPTPGSLQHYQFKFNAQSSSSHGSLPSSRNPSEPPRSLPPHPIYRFGSGSVIAGYNHMAAQAWTKSASTSSQPPPPRTGHQGGLVIDNNGNSKYDLPSVQQSMSYSDDYDDVSEMVDLPSGFPGFQDSSASAAGEKAIRRRSSKACDQCRKSKCKCERSSPGEPCKSCVMLDTPCTFLGPSRKRGPPKGYIDAIEARLHQTEALLGIMLATNDSRAQSLLSDIAKDPLAKEIINRVDNSPYGVKGRKREGGGGGVSKTRASHAHSGSDSSISGQMKATASGRVDLASTHPSNEWQDHVTALLRVTAGDRGTSSFGKEADFPDPSASEKSASRSRPVSWSGVNDRPVLRVNPPVLNIGDGLDDSHSPSRRQRRRVGDEDFTLLEHDYACDIPTSAGDRGTSSQGRRGPRSYPSSTQLVSLSPVNSSFRLHRSGRGGERSTSPVDSISSASEDELTGAVGQLSLNEDEQVRYHGKASGLHLLGLKERVDGRNEGGIWRFPKARVWPPLPSGSMTMNGEDEYTLKVPDRAVQEHLIELYFIYVHPFLPVVHKRSFLDMFKAGSACVESPRSPESDVNSNSSASPFNRRRRRVPTLLLLAMFALAARYADDPSNPYPTDRSMMWVAGDEYLDKAKILLDGSYASSRPSTCQALLLMGYREIGIGAMAQAWTYVGMAIRMAQDLGMHRSADGWARVGLGGRLFAEWELHERKRIWYTCVIMDKYVSTYIGRPLMIFERDFDTPLPSEDDPEEMEEWSLHLPTGGRMPAIPGRIISCFNASATLSGILSTIVQAIYAVHPVSSRHVESRFLEGSLDKWYIDLPEHLRYEPGSSRHPSPSPHVLTLHMQYWCAVLLLHRPFIRQVCTSKIKQSPDDSDGEVRALAEKSYELCAGAANHITSIVSLYMDRYSLSRCAVFLCYYVFTASVMHVTCLTAHPADPQARLGLTKCMEALQDMEIVWPSAGRALELLQGSKVNLGPAELTTYESRPDRQKRSAEQLLDDSFVGVQPNSQRNDYSTTRPQSYHSANFPEPINTLYSGSTLELQPPSPATVTSTSQPFFSSYNRWPSENVNPLSYPGTLSTSVLPQLYSTGLVDDLRASTLNRMQSHLDQSAATHGQRYPQYWNDYSAYSQLGPGYGTLNEQAPIPQQSPQIYLPEQYNIYS